MPATTDGLFPAPLWEYPIRRLTAADLATLPSDLPSGPVRYELHHGVLVIMPPPGDVIPGFRLAVRLALQD